MKTESKKCTLCKQEKPLSEYNKAANRKDGHQTQCRQCTHQRNREYYKKNRTSQIKKIGACKAKRIEENRHKLLRHYLENPCVDCGEADPRVLESDHMRDKDKDISSLLGQGYGWLRIEAELDKCETRCASCHRRKTAIEQNHYSHRLLIERTPDTYYEL